MSRSGASVGIRRHRVDIQAQLATSTSDRAAAGCLQRAAGSGRDWLIDICSPMHIDVLVR